MNPTAKPQKTSPVVKLAIVGSLVIGLFYLNQHLQRTVSRLQQLPVQGQSVENTSYEAADETDGREARRRTVQKSLHPLLVESREKALAQRETVNGGSGASLTALDGSFGRLEAAQAIEERAQEQAREAQRQRDEQERAQKQAREAELAQAQAERLAQAAAAGDTAQGAGRRSLAEGGLPVPVFEPVVPVDPFVELAKVVRVQAVMNGGAIVNGGFFTVGQSVDTLTYWDTDGKRLHPVLHSVQSEQVELAEVKGKRRIVAKLRH